MSEIYWLTRLDNLLVLSVATAMIFGVAVIVLVITHTLDHNDELLMNNGARKKYLKNSVIVLAVSAIVACFLPSSKEAMAIWGLGQTIDYIQENETIKELPDKCVEALDAWLESLTKEE